MAAQDDILDPKDWDRDWHVHFGTLKRVVVAYWNNLEETIN